MAQNAPGAVCEFVRHLDRCLLSPAGAKEGSPGREPWGCDGLPTSPVRGGRAPRAAPSHAPAGLPGGVASFPRAHALGYLLLPLRGLLRSRGNGPPAAKLVLGST